MKTFYVVKEKATGKTVSPGRYLHHPAVRAATKPPHLWTDLKAAKAAITRLADRSSGEIRYYEGSIAQTEKHRKQKVTEYKEAKRCAEYAKTCGFSKKALTKMEREVRDCRAQLVMYENMIEIARGQITRNKNVIAKMTPDAFEIIPVKINI